MNILLVDDEALSVEAIAASIDWVSLGVKNVYKAFNMAQAREVFEKHSIDVMVCDIEMPKGSGIDLVEWIRANGFKTVCIFLSCYSRFEYASTAIRLKIFDYVLKPCEYSILEDVIRRGLETACKTADDLLKQRQGEYWHEGYERIVANFWEALFRGTIKIHDEESLHRQLSLHHLDCELADNMYILFLLEAVPDKDIDPWESGVLGYALRNIVTEMLGTQIICAVRENCYVAIINAEEPKARNFEAVCENVVKALSTELPCHVSAYIDEPCHMVNAADAYRRLEQDAQNVYSLKSMVFRHGVAYQQPGPPNIDPIKWQNAMLELNTDLVLEDICDLLGSEQDIKIVDRNLMNMLYHQLLGAVYFVLNMHHLPAHQPFLNKNITTAFNSIPDFVLWAEDVLENTLSLISSREASSMLITTICQYIRDNLDSDLSRSQIANVVYLNPDYLSTLFRKKSGYSLSQYINMERIAAAKKLLISTDLPINEIATRTGFQNVSYFSKQFKRLEKQTPLNYRNRRLT